MLDFVVDDLETVDEAYRALYKQGTGDDKKFYLQVKGVKTQKDVDAVTTALTKERDAHKKTKDDLRGVKAKVEAFGELDPDEVHEKLDRLAGMEADPNNKDKLEETVKSRVESQITRIKAPLERELKLAKEQLTEATSLVTGFQTKERDRAIDDEVRRVATEAKVIPGALDDVLIIARNYLQVDEHGKITTKETGLTAGDWMRDQAQTRTHWFPQSKGAGAQGGGQQPTNQEQNPFSHKSWNLTEQGKVVKTDHAKAEQLAKAAGTTIGGPRPAAPAQQRAAT